MLLHRRDENECAFIGERERANLVVRTARIFYDRTSSNCACSRITRFFLSEKISTFSHDVVRIYTCTCVYARVTYSRNHGRISPEKMPFVVEERGKENVVPVRLLSRERLVCISVPCVMWNALIFTRCLAVISMRNLASERTLVYSLGFAALLNEAVYTSFQSSWF